MARVKTNEDSIIAANTINLCVAEMAENEVGLSELLFIFLIDNLPPG